MNASRASHLVVPLLAAALVGGCFGGDEPGGSPPDPTNGTADATLDEESLRPRELSEQVLEAAAPSSEATVLGTATGATAGGEAMTVDVLSLQRFDDATLVTLRLTAPEPFDVGPADLGTARHRSQNFGRSVVLEDAATRYLPLQFTDFREACVCPYVPLQLGPEPQTVTAMYPALPPEVTAVTLRVADSDLAVTGLPVGP